jgi:hypothetical protein
MESMESEIQCIILTNDIVLISQIEALGAVNVGEPDCKLVSPYQILGRHETDSPPEERLIPWLGDITDDNTVMLSSDKILTLVEPHKKLIDFYLKLATKE